MSLDKKWDVQTILAKSEVTENVDPIPVVGLDAMQVANFSCKPNSDTVTQAVNRAFFGNDKTHYVNKTYDISFEFELTGSGTVDGLPAHDPIFLACQYTGITNVAADRRYQPDSESTNTMTIYYFQDKILMKATGVRGSLKVNAAIDETTKGTVSMIGTYNAPADVTPGAADYTAFREAILNSEALSELSVHGTLVDGLSIDFDQANTNEKRQSTETNVISNLDRKPTATIEIWAPTLATFDPFAAWDAETRGEVYWQTGTAVGDRVRITMPAAQIGTPELKDQNKVAGYSLPIIPHPTAAGTDDEHEIIFS